MFITARGLRVVLSEAPHHITQRGVDRSVVFLTDGDRQTYLGLLKENLHPAGVRVLGWCLMTNHVHLLLVPETARSLALVLRRVHGRYAQYFNARAGRSGHLWQNRYFACPVDESHLWRALRYVERNPVRAGMVWRAEEYPWSSARAHVVSEDDSGLLDLGWWRAHGPDGSDWAADLHRDEDAADLRRMEECTYAGCPFGDEAFVREVGERYGRHWVPGRPKKAAVAGVAAESGRLFGDEVD